jgi:hypothetical protein
MGRPVALSAEQVAHVYRMLPKALGRPVNSVDVARVFQVSRPCAMKYLKAAIRQGLLDVDPANTAPREQAAS